MNSTKGISLAVILFIAAAIIAGGLLLIRENNNSRNSSVSELPNQNVTNKSFADDSDEKADTPKVSVIAENLDTPWAIAFLPEDELLVTERKGTVRLIKEGKALENPVAALPVKELSEGGLHGIALHPDFPAVNFVYLYYTYGISGGNTLNKVVRVNFENEKLVNEKTLIDGIPGASNHDGGRIKFGPDKYLYITTGDAQEPSLAQNKDSLAGKILRVDDEGNPAPGNPFGNRVYSYGHRNPQGITWDSSGQLWSAEHGPSGFETGNDEVNRIEPGKNYGWPEVRGMQSRAGMETPVIESGKGSTWAPAGIAFADGRLFFTGLRGQALYELDSSGKNLKTHFKGEYGRLREVITGPDGMLYVTTSNRDGRGSPKEADDKILRIDPEKL